MNQIKRFAIGSWLPYTEHKVPVLVYGRPHFAVGSGPEAFTIIELIIVVTLIGIMATFAIPNYTKSIDRAYRKDGTVNLTAIYAAEQIYSNNNNPTKYWPPSGSEDVSAINSNLGLGILSNNLTYSCSGDGATFSCTATRGSMTLTVTEASSIPTCSDFCP